MRGFVLHAACLTARRADELARDVLHSAAGETGRAGQQARMIPLIPASSCVRAVLYLLHCSGSNELGPWTTVKTAQLEVAR